MAVYFLMFTAINANPISLCTLDFPRTDIRVKPKLAFKNPKKALRLFYVFRKFRLFLRLKASLLYILFGFPIFHCKTAFYFYPLPLLYKKCVVGNPYNLQIRILLYLSLRLELYSKCHL